MEIEAYLDGLAATQYAKNPRLAALAGMKVGEQLMLEGPRYLQSHEKQRARILMENPGAKWRAMAVVNGAVIERIA